MATLATGGTITTDGAYTLHTFTTDGNFVPRNSNNVQVECWGGGGGGGGSVDLSHAHCGGGGGGGSYSIDTEVAVTAGTNYAAVVGDGGTATLAAAGGDGEDSSFGTTTVVAKGGGHGGVGAEGTSGHAGVGGTGGTGDTKYSGGSGHDGEIEEGSGGGGGGSGGTGSNGNSATTSVGATAVTGGGNGGNGGTSSGSTPSTSPGGGGGGGGSHNQIGGIGKNGKVVVKYLTTTQEAQNYTQAVSDSITLGEESVDNYLPGRFFRELSETCSTLDDYSRTWDMVSREYSDTVSLAEPTAIVGYVYTMGFSEVIAPTDTEDKWFGEKETPATWAPSTSTGSAWDAVPTSTDIWT